MKFLEVRRIEAKSRQDYYNTLSPKQRLEALDRKFGTGMGALRERARILVKMGAPGGDVAIIVAAVVKLAKGKK